MRSEFQREVVGLECAGQKNASVWRRHRLAAEPEIQGQAVCLESL